MAAGEMPSASCAGFHVATGLRTAAKQTATQKALQEVNEIKGDDSGKVNVTRSYQQLDLQRDRYNDGRAATQTITMPRQAFENDVERYKAGIKARQGSGGRGAPLSINPVLRSNDGEVAKGSQTQRSHGRALQQTVTVSEAPNTARLPHVPGALANTAPTGLGMEAGGLAVFAKGPR